MGLYNILDKAGAVHTIEAFDCEDAAYKSKLELDYIIAIWSNKDEAKLSKLMRQ